MQRSDSSSARPWSSCLSLLCLGLLVSSVRAVPVKFADIESGDAVRNWSNAGVPKTLDANDDDRFGRAGYYQILPAAIGTDNVGLVAGPTDDLGITEDISGAPEGALQTAALTPDFLNGIPTGATGDFTNNTNFPEFTDSTGSELLRQGALWIAALDEFNSEPVPGGIDGIRYHAFSFSLKEAAAFRLGIAVDCLGDGAFSVDLVSITHNGSNEVFSTPLDRNGVPDMVFFDIEGSPDDEFVVSLWEVNESLTGERVASFSLITFDLLPVPTLSYALNGNSLSLSWEPDVSGWTLESSIDLGTGDDWTAVTNPPVVNNSVTLDITGVPKRFFRLRKDP